TRSGACARSCVAAEVRRFADADELGRALAREIVELRPGLLGGPGGRSLMTTYRALGESKADLAGTTIVMMDEYVPVPPPTAHYSCRGFALREIARPLGISNERMWLPDPEDPADYETRIASAGGIDMFL